MPNKNRLQSPITGGKIIQELLPHREPMIMVDTLSYVDDRRVTGLLTILSSNIFVENGEFLETGLIEHMAQAAALFMGYEHKTKNLPIKDGFIAVVKNLLIERLPKVQETIATEAQIDYELGNMKVVTISSTINNSIIATAEMTLVLKEK